MRLPVRMLHGSFPTGILRRLYRNFSGRPKIFCRIIIRLHCHTGQINRCKPQGQSFPVHPLDELFKLSGLVFDHKGLKLFVPSVHQDSGMGFLMQIHADIEIAFSFLHCIRLSFPAIHIKTPVPATSDARIHGLNRVQEARQPIHQRTKRFKQVTMVCDVNSALKSFASLFLRCIKTVLNTEKRERES